MRLRPLLVGMVAVLAAILIQTTLFSRFRFVTPDLVILIAILFALTGLRRESVLVFAFAGGLIVDLLGSTVLGLRAAVFSVVAYLAVRTVDRVDVGPAAVALWVGGITLIGVVLFLLVGTLFGQGGLIGTGLGRRIVLVPLTNMALSLPLAPVLTRLMTTDQRGLL